MILTPEDLDTFASGINLSENAVLGAIYAMQAIVESPGAGRELELLERKEKINIDLNAQSFYFSYFPLVMTPEPIVKIRIGGNLNDSWGRAVPPGSWAVVPPECYTLDVDGQLHLGTAAFPWYPANGFPGYQGIQQLYGTVAELTYTSGLDFTQVENPEIIKLKASAGMILKWITTSGVYRGVETIDIPFQEFRIKYSASATQLIGTIPDDLLLPFRKYQPRMRSFG